MSQKKNYSRSFIILQENEKGHGISSDKLPTGYTKIELKNGKCKVSYYVQNLKKGARPYHMILICNKKDTKKLIKFGEISLDQDGKSEASKEFEGNNIIGSGISTDKIIGAAIVQFIDKDMVVVMSGFNASDIPDSWKTYPLVGEMSEKKPAEVEVKKEVKVEAKKEVKAEVKKEAKPEHKKEAKIEVKEEVKVEKPRTETKVDSPKVIVDEENKNIFEQYEKDIEESKSKIKLENENINDNSDKEKLDVEVEKDNENVELSENTSTEVREENKDYDGEYFNQSSEAYPTGRMGRFFRNLAEDFEDLGEYFPDVRCCKWYKVPLNSEEEDYNERNHNKHALIYYPMMAYYPYIQKNGYYLIGYKYDKNGKMKYIVYGILGTKSKYDQPFYGRTGFVSWVPLERGKEEEDSKGCWLMFYDFKNAAILVPERR